MEEINKKEGVTKTVVIDNAVDMAPLYIEYGHGKEVTPEVAEEIKRGYLAGMRDALAIFGQAPAQVQASVLNQIGQHFGLSGEKERMDSKSEAPREPLGKVFVSRKGPQVI